MKLYTLNTEEENDSLLPLILHQPPEPQSGHWMQTRFETKDTKTMLSITPMGPDLIFNNRPELVPEIGSNHEA